MRYELTAVDKVRVLDIATHVVINTSKEKNSDEIVRTYKQFIEAILDTMQEVSKD